MEIKFELETGQIVYCIRADEDLTINSVVDALVIFVGEQAKEINCLRKLVEKHETLLLVNVTSASRQPGCDAPERL
ncbi:hypothetical protein QUA84_09350 [Microcoleus sp. F8-C3]